MRVDRSVRVGQDSRREAEVWTFPALAVSHEEQGPLQSLTAQPAE